MAMLKFTVALLALAFAANACLAQTFPKVDTTNKVFIGYRVGRDVTPYRGLSIDCFQIRARIQGRNWAGANAIYTNGLNFVRTTGVRGLKTIGTTARPGEPYYDLFAGFYGGAGYVERALSIGATGLTATVGAERAIAACMWTTLGYVFHELDVAKKVLSANALLAAEEVDDAFGIWFGYPTAASLWNHNSQVEKWVPCAGAINNRFVAAFNAMQRAVTAKSQAQFDAQYKTFSNLVVTVYLRSVMYAGTKKNAALQRSAFGYLKTIQPFLSSKAAAAQLSAALASPAVVDPVAVRTLVTTLAVGQRIPARDAGVC